VADHLLGLKQLFIYNYWLGSGSQKQYRNGIRAIGHMIADVARSGDIGYLREPTLSTAGTVALFRVFFGMELLFCLYCLLGWFRPGGASVHHNFCLLSCCLSLFSI
jgi:hypothetical protein